MIRHKAIYWSDHITPAGKNAGVALPEHRQHHGVTIKMHDGSEMVLPKWNPLESHEDCEMIKNMFGIRTSYGDDDGKHYVQAQIKGCTSKLYLSCIGDRERSMRYIITKLVAEYGGRDER